METTTKTLGDALFELTEAIKADPEGKEATNTAHWLATDVMGWRLVPGPKSYLGHWVEKDADDTDVMEIGEGEFNPFTDANHTRMLVRKFIETRDKTEFSYDPLVNACEFFSFQPYVDDTTQVACAVMANLTVDKKLTHETIKDLLG